MTNIQDQLQGFATHLARIVEDYLEDYALLNERNGIIIDPTTLSARMVLGHRKQPDDEFWPMSAFLGSAPGGRPQVSTDKAFAIASKYILE